MSSKAFSDCTVSYTMPKPSQASPALLLDLSWSEFSTFSSQFLQCFDDASVFVQG